VRILLDTLLDPGDEVIVADPGFVSHIHQIRLSSGQPVYWPLDEKQGWSVSVEKLEGLVTPRTRVILLVTPSNPTGTIFSRVDLLRVAEIARHHKVLVALDDPYSDFFSAPRSAISTSPLPANTRATLPTSIPSPSVTR
jgi:aspartate/methionine/tyrosine aminotransferase